MAASTTTSILSARVIDSLPGFLFPTRRRGTRWLREKLSRAGRDGAAVSELPGRICCELQQKRRP